MLIMHKSSNIYIFFSSIKKKAQRILSIKKNVCAIRKMYNFEQINNGVIILLRKKQTITRLNILGRMVSDGKHPGRTRCHAGTNDLSYWEFRMARKSLWKCTLFTHMSGEIYWATQNSTHRRNVLLLGGEKKIRRKKKYSPLVLYKIS